ncbi:MAG: hypothetical protein HKN29_13805 [Rhodothermales bacterium]|nr:hypothetical protein [Rhodothermales bacterium]
MSRGLLPAVGLWLLAGCGPVLPEVESLQVERASWDSVLVVLHFEKPASLAARPILPDHVVVTLFDAHYDTLYTGRDSVLFVPDGMLGPNEPVLVEACGIFGTSTVCEQRPIHASPKRIDSEVVVTYPTDSEEMARGTYRLAPRLRRARFGASDWEDVEGLIPDSVEALVRVLDTEDSGLRVPMRLGGGRFDLRRAEGYRDYRFYLMSALRERGEAEVEFRLITKFRNGPLTVGSSVVSVNRKSEEEQAAEVSLLAEAAGNVLLRRLSRVSSNRRAYVFVNEWEYLPDTRRYRAEIELHWKPIARRNWRELVGRLEAGERGDRARLTLIRASDEARRAWEDEVSGEILELGNLESDPGEERR